MRAGATRAQLEKISKMRESATVILTFLTAQLPYTYVSLVSLVVHVYLFILATWFGFLFSSGMNDEDTYSLQSRSIVGESATMSVRSEAHSYEGDYLTPAFGYLFIAFSNVLFQGLLSIHSLLDNPFGGHPAKFPLRAHTEYLAAITRGFIRPSSATAMPGLDGLFTATSPRRAERAGAAE